MASHSSILAWRIPWTEEPGRLQSMGLQESNMTERLSAHAHILGVYSTIFKYSIGGEMLAFPSAVSYTFVQTAP